MPEKSSKTQPEKIEEESVKVEQPKTKSRLPNKSLTNAEVAEKKQKKDQKAAKTPEKDNSGKTEAKKSDPQTQKVQKSESNKINVKIAPKKPTEKTEKPVTKKETKVKIEKPQTSEPAKTSSAETIKVKTIKTAKPNPKPTTKKIVDIKNPDIKPEQAPKSAQTKPVSNAKKNQKAQKRTDTKVSFLTIFSRNIAGVLGLSSLFFIITLIRLNVLPTRYLLLAIFVIIIIGVGCGFVLWREKSKAPLKIPVNVISIIFSCIYLVGGGYITQATGFLDNLQSQEYISEQYYIIVRNDSSFASIEDLEGKTIGTFDESLEIYQEAIRNLQETVNADLKNIASVRTLTDDLLSDKLDAIFLSAVYKSVVDEDDAKFSQNTKILYTIEAKVKLDVVHEASNIDVTSEPFTVYISGNDSYSDLASRGLSDVNMLATVNPITHEILLTSIPRDYYVELHDNPGALDKLTHAGMYGVQMSIQTLEDLLSININYYVKINFPALVNLVDAIGGIDVYSDKSFKPLHGDKFVHEGMNHFDGKMALAFARERMAYAWGDRHRVQNQRDVLNAIIKKVSSSTVILTKTNEILSSVASNLDTNIGKSEISSLVKLQLQDMPSWKVGEFMLNGQDAYEYTYTFNDQLRYVMYPDANSVQAAHNYITGILEGKSLDELNIPKQTAAPGQ